MRALICILAVLLAGCTKENAFDCFKSSGPDKSQFRYPGPFRHAAIFDNMEMRIVHGTEYKVEIRAGQNLFTGIDTYISNDTLYIENNNVCNFVRGYSRKIVITLTVPRLEKLVNMGVGDVHFASDFSQDTLLVRAESSGDVFINGVYNQVRISSHGNGDIYLAGSCRELRAYMNGINYLFATEMKVTDEIFVETLSLGHCYVNASNLRSLSCNIWKDGNIYYSGDPANIANYSKGGQKGRLIREE